MASKEADLTIDELARRTGMTARNIRAHQSRGLLPPPEVRGRTGYYGPEHLARLELIRELQAEGFNLETIRRLIETGDGSSADVLRFTRAVREPFEDEEPEVVTLDQVARAFGPGGGPEVVERAVKLGLLHPLDDSGERYEQPSPRLARAARELRELGVPPQRALGVAAELRRHADQVAKLFVRLFLDEVWKPFVAAGRPPDRWPEVAEALERMRPLAAASVLAIFQLSMSEAVERAFGRELERMRRTPRHR
jgi:DNA-binding transcriptional MerR regulator